MLLGIKWYQFVWNNEVEAVQHVHLTNIPVWFGLQGDIKDGRT